MDDLITSFKTISVKDVSSESAELIPILEQLVAIAESKASSLETVDITNEFVQLLIKAETIELKEQINRSIAEVTKIDEQRKRFTNAAIIEQLLKHLDDLKAGKDDQFKIAIQSCRALGNICYNNEDARNIILKINGDEKIINLLDLKLCASNEIDITFGKLRGGLISNYLLGGEHLAKHAMELHILEKIEKIIDDCSTDIERNEEILLNTLQPLSLLTENVADLNFSIKLNAQLVNILAVSKHPDVAEICLEMLNYQAENGECQ